MSNPDLRLMAQLMRRAGFGATSGELEECASRGYDVTVEELLDPTQRRSMGDDLVRRYHVDQSELRLVNSAAASWLYRMIGTSAPLEEKMALFWHGLFATGEAKVGQVKNPGQPDRHVPQARAGQVSRSAGPALERPRHDRMVGQ